MKNLTNDKKTQENINDTFMYRCTNLLYFIHDFFWSLLYKLTWQMKRLWFDMYSVLSTRRAIQIVMYVCMKMKQVLA